MDFVDQVFSTVFLDLLYSFEELLVIFYTPRVFQSCVFRRKSKCFDGAKHDYGMTSMPCVPTEGRAAAAVRITFTMNDFISF